MAEVRLDFTGEDSGLRDEILAMRDAYAKLLGAQQEFSKSIQADAQKNVAATERLNKALTDSVAATVLIGKSDTGKLSQGLDEAADSAEHLEEAAETGAESMKSAFEEIVIEAKKVAKEQGIVVGRLDEQKSKSIDLLKSIGALTTEEAKLAKEALSVVDAFEKQGDNFTGPVQGAKSLRTEIREAKDELNRLIEASDGQITPDLIAAAQRAGELDDRFKDLNATVAAFNPDQRLRPVIGVLSNIASGFQAATAAAGLFGGASEDIGRALLRIQQTVAFVQGLQGFLGGLQDNLKNLRTIILATASAQRTATVATAADAAAKGVQATATGAATATTITFTGAVRGLTAALLANPFTAIAVALLAIGAALVSVLSDTEDLKEEVDSLISSLDELTQARFRQIELQGNLKLIQNEIDLIREGNTERGKAQKAEEDYFARRAILMAKQFELEQNAIALRNQLLRLLEEGADEEVLQAAIDAGKKALSEFQGINDEIRILERTRTKDTLEQDAARLKSARDLARKRLQIEEGLANDLAAIQRDLQKRAQAAEIEEADPRRKLELQKEAALAEVRVLEQTLKRKIALIEIEKKLGAELFSELTENQKNARADALIDTGVIELALKQTEQLQVLEFAAWSKYYDGLSELDRANVAERLKIQQDGNEKELALLEIQLSETARKQREAGATEAEILAFKQRERERVQRELNKKDIDLEEQLLIATIEARERGAQVEVEFERKKQLDILAVKIEFAQKALKNLETDQSKEGEVLRAQLRATIAGLQQEVRDIQRNAPDLDLFQLLGLDFTDAEKQRVISGLNQIIGLASAFTAAAQAEVAANIAATDQILADRERRVSELSRLLDAEVEKAKLGQANNEAIIRQRIAAEDRAAEEEKRRRRDLLAEQRRLAKQQLAIDAVIQGSALITAAATALAHAAKEGGVPAIIAAIGAIAGMIAFFIGIQQQVKALTATEQSLGKGGMIEGKRHSQGGVPIPGTNVVAEGGEWVTNRKSTRKHLPALEAINDDDFTSPGFGKWLTAQLEPLGIGLDRAFVDQMVEDKREYLSEVTVNQSMDTKRLERRVDELTNELVGLRSDISKQDQHFEEKGKSVVVRGNKTTRKR